MISLFGMTTVKILVLVLVVFFSVFSLLTGHFIMIS